MTRIYVSLTTAIVALAVSGCAKNKPEDTQNPDGTAADGAGDGTGDADAQTPSRARGATSTRGAGSKAKGRTASLAAKKPPRAPSTTPQDKGPNGLQVELFATDPIDKLPSYESIGAVIETFTVPNVDFDDAVAANFAGSKKATGNYAMRFTGSINVEAEAEYELCLHSDDGSQLLLEGTLVVSNDGVFDSATETCELVYLAAGEYQLEIDYFQADGPSATLHFAWAVDGGEKGIVPTEVLFKPAAPTTR